VMAAFLALRTPDIFGGRPGRLDRMCILEPQQSGPTYWRTVNWASVRDQNQYWVATREHLPEAYLEQLVASLRKAGLVQGKRGAGGGYTLSREPRRITAGDIVRALEGPIEPQICTAEGEAVKNCSLQPGCATHHVWMSVQQNIAKALDGMTLEALAKTPVAMRESARA